MNSTYKAAIKYFQENPNVSIKETAIRFNIDRGTLGRVLTNLNFNNSKERVKKYHFNESYFENVDTEEKAYWLGWLHSDGNISNGRVRLRIKDIEMLEKFNDCLESDIEIKIEDNAKGFSKNTESKIANLTIHSKKMCEDLKKYGIISNKSLNIDFYNFENIKLTKSYIRGIFDGDGWCYFSDNSREIGFCGSLNTCKGIQKILSMYGIKNIKITPIKTIYRIRICNKAGIKIFYEEFLKGYKNLSLKRKFDQIEKFAVSERASKNLKIK